VGTRVGAADHPGVAAARRSSTPCASWKAKTAQPVEKALRFYSGSITGSAGNAGQVGSVAKGMPGVIGREPELAMLEEFLDRGTPRPALMLTGGRADGGRATGGRPGCEWAVQQADCQAPVRSGPYCGSPPGPCLRQTRRPFPGAARRPPRVAAPAAKRAADPATRRIADPAARRVAGPAARHGLRVSVIEPGARSWAAC
jgi:hypothetical protein